VQHICCNLSLYTHIPNIKSISQSIAEKSGHNCFISELWTWVTLYDSSRWALKFGQIFSCHHFFSLCLEILTWFLVYMCIMMSYRSSLHFVPVQCFLAYTPTYQKSSRYLQAPRKKVVTKSKGHNLVKNHWTAWRYWLDFWYMSV
jgi:hypothetical protein